MHAIPDCAYVKGAAEQVAELARTCSELVPITANDAESVSLSGTGKASTAPVFVDRVKAMTLHDEGIAQEVVVIVRDYVGSIYARRS